MNSVLSGTCVHFTLYVGKKGQIIKDHAYRKLFEDSENFINMGTTSMHMKIFLTSW